MNYTALYWVTDLGGSVGYVVCMHVLGEGFTYMCMHRHVEARVQPWMSASRSDKISHWP